MQPVDLESLQYYNNLLHVLYKLPTNVKMGFWTL